jgi:[acyl-carrier-protein] S-malonyltransferase
MSNIDRQLAIVFPGQGSQSIGMLAEMGGAYPVVGETFDAASEVLGYDLWRLIQDGPEADLNRTDRTQPAMLVAGVAVWRVWRQCGGPLPAFMAGHSLGEYTALACVDAISFECAVELVAERGRYMQEAVPEGQGAMAAILGLEDEVVIALCKDVAQGEVVAAVNFNSPGQVVVAGQASAIERAIARAKENGAKRALLLPVSVPSHCALMQPAAERMRRLLDETAIVAPAVPVLHNADVAAFDDAGQIRDALVRQLYSPVRWVETIRHMKQQGVRRIVECGPGKVLTGLARRIDRDLTAIAVHDTPSLQEALDHEKQG